MVTKFFNQTITKKMNQVFILVTLISTILSSVVIYQYSRDISLKESKKNALVLGEQLANNFETSIKSLEDNLYIKSSYIDTSTQNSTLLESSYKKDNFFRLLLWNFLYSDNSVEAVTIVSSDNKIFEISKPEVSVISRFSLLKNEEETLKNLYGRCEYSAYDDNHILIKRALFSPIDSAYVGYGVFLINTNQFSGIFSRASHDMDFIIMRGDKIFFSTNNDIKLPLSLDLSKDTSFIHDKNKYYITSTPPSEKGWSLKIIIKNSLLTHSIRNLPYLLLFIGIISIILIYIIGYFISRRIALGVENLSTGFKKIGYGNLNTELKVIDHDEIGEMTSLFNIMTKEIRRLITEVKKQEELKTEAMIKQMDFQYKALQTQINPHFLYNSLEIINSKAKIEGVYSISEVVCTLSRLLRVAMDTSEKFVSLADELSYIQDYLEIYRLTHSGETFLDINIDTSLLKVQIPKLILQPIVENALIHGFSSLETERKIIIDVFSDSNILYIQIEDNGKGMNKEKIATLQENLKSQNETSDNIGLSSVYRRLKILYENDCDLSFFSEENNGTVITLQLPIKE
ncbi:MAG: histidine kinase [Sphaerochaetaceae bacterium]|nr:histidine kinase [Sphaerochaetaceae bacterium]